MLPIILVRNQIRVTLGGEIGKITFGRIKNKLRTSSNMNSSLCTVYWYIQWEGATFKVVVVRFMIVFVTRRDSTSSKLRVVTVSPL